jgi:hypothetical protein
MGSCAPVRAGAGHQATSSTPRARVRAGNATENQPARVGPPASAARLGRGRRLSRSAPIRELRAAGLAEERVNVRVLDCVGRVVCLRVDRPQVAVALLRDEIDARVRRPRSQALRPQPRCGSGRGTPARCASACACRLRARSSSAPHGRPAERIAGGHFQSRPQAAHLSGHAEDARTASDITSAGQTSPVDRKSTSQPAARPRGATDRAGRHRPTKGTLALRLHSLTLSVSALSFRHHGRRGKHARRLAGRACCLERLWQVAERSARAL